MIKQLLKEFEFINDERSLQLPKLKIQLSEHMTSWGSWNQSLSTIYISKQLLSDFDWFIVLEVLKHEIAHAYVDFHLSPSGHEEPHGSCFQRACIRVGTDPWARKSHLNPHDIRHNEKRKPGQTPPMVRRIQKLLALSTSQNEYEAAEAIQKARELSEKYHIQELEAQQEDYLDLVIDLGYKRLPQHTHSITSILINFYHVQVIQAPLWSQKTFEQHQVLHLLGSKINVTLAEYVFGFLWNQLPLLWEQHHKLHPDTPIRMKKSFYQGLLNGFYYKLDKETGNPQSQSQSTHHKSLIEQGEARMHRYVKSRFPRLRRVSMGCRSLHKDSFEAGKNIGKNLEIRGGLPKHTKPSSSNLGLFLTP